MKLSDSERDFLAQLEQGTQRDRGPDLWALWELGLIGNIGLYPAFFITPTGREALEAEDA